MQTQERKKIEKATKIYTAVVFFIIAILVGRLAWLQIWQNDLYQSKADNNRNRLMTITAKRGDIISSDGVVLVTDRPSYQVVLDNQIVRGNTEVIETLAKILNDEKLTAEAIQEICDENRMRLYKPIVLKKNIDIETVSQIEARRSELEGVSIESASDRTYLYGNIAGHVLGYLGEVSQAELDAQANGETDTNYRMGDYVGKVGLEKYYDQILRGKDGYKQVEVNANNRPLSDVKIVEPMEGANLVLTLNYELQKVLEEALDKNIALLKTSKRSDKVENAAAVVIEVNTGAVLAMASRPDDKITQQNRVIQGRYIPGSIFKPITAIAALETGNVTPTEKIHNPGRYWKAPYIKSTAPIGYYNLYSAMGKSDNVYFQEIGRRTGIDAIGYYGAEFGLDTPTGIDLAYENRGERVSEGLPTEEKRQAYHDWAGAVWAERYDKKIVETEEEYEKLIAAATTNEEKKALEKKRKNAIAILEADKKINVKWNTEWHEADTYNVAIGQGRQNYTPMQLAVYIAAIANGGTVYQPYLVQKICDSQGSVLQEIKPTILHQANVSVKTLAEIQKSLLAVTDVGGTAYGYFQSFPKDIKVAAKTGTAQPGGSGYRTSTQQYYDGVFVAYAPADNPQIAFVSVVEYGYSGAGSGAPVCKAVFEEYFGLNQEGVIASEDVFMYNE